MYSIETFIPEQGPATLSELVTLLQDAVTSGASIGFLPPLSNNEARVYWTSIFEDVTRKQRVLLIARRNQQIVGAVQLELSTKSNAQHRAEIQKLFVLQQERKHGIGQCLMEAVEAAAHELGRTLLVLDTRAGDNAERLYRRLQYKEAGSIPAYARNADGTLDATIIFYKLLQ
ncbi:MAG TPA: GNAT family N-acetyltransferase [Ktedonobacteraceae bacterium]|nr:GNAT family N-acetyltransferase [Ktedonobacteraceae bacterium]